MKLASSGYDELAVATMGTSEMLTDPISSYNNLFSLPTSNVTLGCRTNRGWT